LSLLDEVGYDAVFAFKYSPRPNTPALKYADAVPEEEKSRRLQILMEKTAGDSGDSQPASWREGA